MSIARGLSLARHQALSSIAGAAAVPDDFVFVNRGASLGHHVELARLVSVGHIDRGLRPGIYLTKVR
jgi:hypothetical protein